MCKDGHPTTGGERSRRDVVRRREEEEGCGGYVQYIYNFITKYHLQYIVK